MEEQHGTILDRINRTYDSFKTARKYMDENRRAMREIEEEIKLSDEYYEEWATAKNNDIRYVLVLRWINADPDLAERYHDHRRRYNEWRLSLREAAIDGERLKLEIGAVGAYANVGWTEGP